MQEEQIREAFNAHCSRRQPAMQMRNTISTMTMPSAITLSQASASSGEAICRPCGVIIPAAVRLQRRANSRRGQYISVMFTLV
jgi:hypothetical protein